MTQETHSIYLSATDTDVFGDVNIPHPSLFYYSFYIFSYLWLNLNWYVRNCLTAFLPFQFIFQDSWWALHSVAKTGGGNTSTPLIKCDSENIKPRAVNQGKQLWLFYKNFNGHQRLSFNSFFPPATNSYFLQSIFLQCVSHSLSFSTNVPDLLILYLHQQVINQP